MSCNFGLQVLSSRFQASLKQRSSFINFSYPRAECDANVWTLNICGIELLLEPDFHSIFTFKSSQTLFSHHFSTLTLESKNSKIKCLLALFFFNCKMEVLRLTYDPAHKIK